MQTEQRQKHITVYSFSRFNNGLALKSKLDERYVYH